MKAETLKNSILQWAVEGKLVPQLDCEPAVEQIGGVPENVPFTIPEKWKWVKLGNAFELKAGKFIAASEIKKEGPYPCYGGNGIRGYVDHYNKEGKFPLIGRQGALCGNINVATGKFYATEHAVVANGGTLVDPGCAAFFLDQLNLNQYATSTAQPGLSVKRISETPFPLPPIEEQHRIAEKLNELLPLVESYGREQEVLERLEKELPGKLRASLLNEAIQGKLVPQLDSEPQVKQLSETLEDVTFAIPEKWKWATLSEVATKIQYGYTASASDSGSARLLRITDIQDGQVEWNSTPYCSPTASEIKKFELKTGDILIARTGGTIGKSFLVQKTPSEPSVFASYLIRISPETQLISPNFLKFFLESPYYWTQLKDNSRGTGQPNVNAKALGNLRLPLPPLEEQRRIVEKLNALFKDLDRLTG